MHAGIFDIDVSPPASPHQHRRDARAEQLRHVGREHLHARLDELHAALARLLELHRLGVPEQALLELAVGERLARRRRARRRDDHHRRRREQDRHVHLVADAVDDAQEVELVRHERLELGNFFEYSSTTKRCTFDCSSSIAVSSSLDATMSLYSGSSSIGYAIGRACACDVRVHHLRIWET